MGPDLCSVGYLTASLDYTLQMPIAAHPHPERRAKMSLDPADASGCRESGDTKEPPAENYSFTTMTFSIFVREHLQGNSWSLEKHPRML